MRLTRDSCIKKNGWFKDTLESMDYRKVQIKQEKENNWGIVIFGVVILIIYPVIMQLFNITGYTETLGSPSINLINSLLFILVIGGLLLVILGLYTSKNRYLIKESHDKNGTELKWSIDIGGVLLFDPGTADGEKGPYSNLNNFISTIKEQARKRKEQESERSFSTFDH